MIDHLEIYVSDGKRVFFADGIEVPFHFIKGKNIINCTIYESLPEKK